MENTKKQRPDGTSIGLYMAKQVVDLYNGEMFFEGVEGRGGTFGFRLPLTSKSKKASQNIKNVV